MTTFLRSLVWLKFCGAALVSLQATFLFAFQQIPELVLEFPTDNSVGIITVSNPPQYEGKHLIFDQDARKVHQAYGRVTLPKDGFIGLELSEKSAEDLSFLTTLQPNALHSIKLSGAKLGKAELAHLVELQSLVKLELSNCEFLPDAFDDLPAMPELLSLSITQRSNGNAAGLPIAKWIAKLPKVEIFYSNPTPDVAALSEIGAHPTLAWIYVELGSDSKGLLESLSNLPSLRGLSFSVTEDVDDETLQGLANLDQLERLRWFNGPVSGDVLRGIAKHNRLKRLLLAQVEPGKGFCKGIESLSQLTHLEITNLPDGFHKRTKGLAKTLLRMPNLVEWPKLRNINAETLERVVDVARIEKLTLDGVASDVTPNHLFKLGKLKSLKSLSLQGIPVHDDWLSSLSELRTLELLDLFDTGVTGSGFAALDKLKDLREVRLFYAVVDDAQVQPELSSLCDLPALENLQIGGDFGPADIEPLRKCKTLRKLRLWGGGFTDDSTAATIGELQGLTELTLSDNCVITDVGALALAKLPNLQKLWVGGFVTRAGGMELAKISLLRSLLIGSSLLSKEDQTELRTTFPSIPRFMIRPFSGDVSFGEDGLLRKTSRGDSLVVTGKDGLLRQISDDEESLRARMNSLEGKLATELLGAEDENMGGQLDWSTLKGKVVLIDFWGTWCGPCRMQLPELQKLHKKYHEQGFEIVGVHTKKGAKNLDAYLKKKPLPWETIKDSTGKIAGSFQVPHYPSLYLVDRQGVLRVALAHKAGLDTAIGALLKEKN